MPRHPRLAVLGSLNMDIAVTVAHLPAPGETILGSDAVIGPGGKGGNQAIAAARLGAEVRMIGCTGDDDFGRMARDALAGQGVDVSAVRVVDGAATGIALITVDGSGENMITVAPGANARVGHLEGARALGTPREELLILSAEVPLDFLAQVATAARTRQAQCVLNLAPAPADRDEGLALVAVADWLVVNETEAAALLGHPVTGLRGAVTAAEELCALGARSAVVTAGAEGAALDGAAGTGATPGFRVRSVDAVGAGDAFVGALGTLVGGGLPGIDAVRVACAAGAAATTRRGTQNALPRPADIFAATGQRWLLDG
jgi:ribokinase